MSGEGRTTQARSRARAPHSQQPWTSVPARGTCPRLGPPATPPGGPARPERFGTKAVQGVHAVGLGALEGREDLLEQQEPGPSSITATGSAAPDPLGPGKAEKLTLSQQSRRLAPHIHPRSSAQTPGLAGRAPAAREPDTRGQESAATSTGSANPLPLVGTRRPLNAAQGRRQNVRKGCCGHMRCVRRSDQKEEEPRPQVHSRPRQAPQPSGGHDPGHTQPQLRKTNREKGCQDTGQRRNMEQQRKHRALRCLSQKRQGRGTLPSRREPATLATPTMRQAGQGDGREAHLHGAAL